MALTPTVRAGSSRKGELMESKLLLKVAETGERLNVSRATVYNLIRDNKLDSVKVGRSRRVPVEAVERYVASLSEAN